MRLVSRYFATPWALIALLQSHMETFAYRRTATITVFNEGFYGALRVRQAGGPNPTCGWIDGNEAEPVTCGPEFICGTTRSTIVGCCTRTTGSALCNDIVTACYDFLGATCDAACQANVNNLICINPSPYCVEYVYPSGSQGYGCGPYTRFTETVSLTTNNGGGGSLTGIATDDTSSSSSSSSLVPSLSTTVNSPPSPPPSSSSLPSQSTTGLSAGAIAGISVGSVVGAILVSLISCLIWRRKKKKQQQQQQTTAAETFTQRSAASEMPSSVREPEAARWSLQSPKIVGSPPSRSPENQPEWMHLGLQGPYIGPTIPEMDVGDHRE